jgi:hypothetical protein
LPAGRIGDPATRIHELAALALSAEAHGFHDQQLVYREAVVHLCKEGGRGYISRGDLLQELTHEQARYLYLKHVDVVRGQTRVLKDFTGPSLRELESAQVGKAVCVQDDAEDISGGAHANAGVVTTGRPQMRVHLLFSKSNDEGTSVTNACATISTA